MIDVRQRLQMASGKRADYYSLPQLQTRGSGNISRLPVSVRILLESVLRHVDGRRIRNEDVEALARWQPGAARTAEVPFVVGRVLLQDFTAFVLTRHGEPTGLRAQTLREFVTLIVSQPIEAFDSHLRRGDFSRWIADVFGDTILAGQLRHLEDGYRTGRLLNVNDAIAGAVQKRYELGAAVGTLAHRRRPENRHAPSPGPRVVRHHRNKLVRARSTSSSPRPFKTALAMYKANPPTCSICNDGGIMSSCVLTRTSRSAGPS